MALAYRLCLQSIRGVGPKGARAIRSLAPEHEDARQLTAADWLAVGLGDAVAAELFRCLQQGRGEGMVERVVQSGVSYVLDGEESYPALLREIPFPPAVLFYDGDLATLRNPCVAVVGTRKATSYGRKAAREIAQSLAARGATVVSGLARGIDAAAHEGALLAGTTAAVLGSGVRRVYPAEHEGLALRVVAGGGCVISEFLPWDAPERHHFPRRNRIISGLCRAVIIVEAGRRSGALITADFALEQNRDVYAVPGSIYSDASDGCNGLLHSGATPVAGVRSLCMDLGLESLEAPPEAARATEPDPVARAIRAELAPGGLSFDELRRGQVLGSLAVRELLQALTALELRGLIRRDSRGRYCLI